MSSELISGLTLLVDNLQCTILTGIVEAQRTYLTVVSVGFVDAGSDELIPGNLQQNLKPQLCFTVTFLIYLLLTSAPTFNKAYAPPPHMKDGSLQPVPVPTLCDSHINCLSEDGVEENVIPQEDSTEQS